MTNQKTTSEWEEEFDICEAKIWQFAGLHPDFKNHTCEMVKDFIRTLIKEKQKEAIEEWKDKIVETYKDIPSGVMAMLIVDIDEIILTKQKEVIEECCQKKRITQIKK